MKKFTIVCDDSNSQKLFDFLMPAIKDTVSFTIEDVPNPDREKAAFMVKAGATPVAHPAAVKTKKKLVVHPTNKGMVALLELGALAAVSTVKEFKRADVETLFEQRGLNKRSASPVLSQAKSNGLIAQVGQGVYVMTAEGQKVADRL